ncbi:10421_t:CDS:2 [Ambispora gerdemannii]|uniref:10421_t:CDS:1 n=1 Tax=Ambispora gerdemannii TaxID=144530 RepID=A0A9N9AUB7_9GLOM|nr:10421_t:CDS:2 [Ambispora gerdemannii]
MREQNFEESKFKEIFYTTLTQAFRIVSPQIPPPQQQPSSAAPLQPQPSQVVAPTPRRAAARRSATPTRFSQRIANINRRRNERPSKTIARQRISEYYRR